MDALFKPTCGFCHREGHFTRSCRKAKKKEKDEKQSVFSQLTALKRTIDMVLELLVTIKYEEKQSTNEALQKKKEEMKTWFNSEVKLKEKETKDQMKKENVEQKNQMPKECVGTQTLKEKSQRKTLEEVNQITAQKLQEKKQKHLDEQKSKMKNRIKEMEFTEYQEASKIFAKEFPELNLKECLQEFTDIRVQHQVEEIIKKQILQKQWLKEDEEDFRKDLKKKISLEYWPAIDRLTSEWINDIWEDEEEKFQEEMEMEEQRREMEMEEQRKENEKQRKNDEIRMIKMIKEKEDQIKLQKEKRVNEQKLRLKEKLKTMEQTEFHEAKKMFQQEFLDLELNQCLEDFADVQMQFFVKKWISEYVKNNGTKSKTSEDLKKEIKKKAISEYHHAIDKIPKDWMKKIWDEETNKKKQRDEQLKLEKEEQERIEDRKQRIWNEMIQCRSWKEILENVMRDDDEGEKIVLEMKEDWEQRIKEKQKQKHNRRSYY